MAKMWTRRTWITLAALAGFLAVAAGAFGAHGVESARAKEWLRTAATYGLIHALATFACALFMSLGAARARFAPAFFLGGVAIFSGSLCAMALGAPRGFGAITPIGGVLFLIGWLVLALAARDIDRVGRVSDRI
jgi:uncharacterized membrane protein YgdD (TMEM256/DUF423 family)